MGGNRGKATPAMAPELERAVGALGWHPVKLFKDDAVSQVWLLGGPEGEALLKRSRSGRRLFHLLPRFFTGREVRILELLGDLPGIPRVLARIDERTFLREFAPGIPLKEATDVEDGFFPLLLERLAAVHGRGVACVDLSKRDNILVGVDGEPVLMDFQAAWHLRPGGVGMALFGFLLRALQRGDVYHVYKHRDWRFPAKPIPPPPPHVERRPLGVRLHATLLRKPYLKIKRLFFGRSSS